MKIALFFFVKTALILAEIFCQVGLESLEMQSLQQFKSNQKLMTNSMFLCKFDQNRMKNKKHIEV